MYFDYESKNIFRAKALRSEMTPHERKLWYCFLRGYSSKFLRQRPVGNYILDFYCADAKLAVELDGGQHFELDGSRYDAERDGTLNGLGIYVLRFTNRDIDCRFREVTEEIDRAVGVRRRTPQSAGADSSPR